MLAPGALIRNRCLLLAGWLSWLLGACLLGACAPAIEKPKTQRAPLAPIALLPVTALGESFIWEQRVTASWGQQSSAFDAVLQRQGDKLLLVGLTPLKTPAFVLTYQKGEVTFRNYTKRRLPFSPRYMLADVQLAFFPGSRHPSRASTGRVAPGAPGSRSSRRSRRDDSQGGSFDGCLAGRRVRSRCPTRAGKTASWRRRRHRFVADGTAIG